MKDLSKKKNLNIDDIQLRKKTLQAELELIEEKYSRKASKISDRIEGTIKPIQTIRDNPFKSVGVFIAVGFIIGASGRKKGKYVEASSGSEFRSVSGDSGFTSLLFSELKRMAARRAMVFISDFVDRKVMPELTSSISNSSKRTSPSDIKPDGQ